MNNKSINSNKQFMIGNGILAFGVFFIVCLFLYLGFRNQSKSNDKEKTFAGIYTVEIPIPSLETVFRYISMTVYYLTQTSEMQLLNFR